MIDGYPDRNLVFIGLFMCEVSIQNRGVGTEIITELLDVRKENGYKSVQLAWVKGNICSLERMLSGEFPISSHLTEKIRTAVFRKNHSIGNRIILLPYRQSAHA